MGVKSLRDNFLALPTNIVFVGKVFLRLLLRNTSFAYLACSEGGVAVKLLDFSTV